MAKVTSLGYAATSFTPTVTCATPGDLSISYATRTGTFWTVGNMCFYQVNLTFTPTFTTATGSLSVSNMPITSKSGAGDMGALFMSGAALASPPGSCCSFVGSATTSMVFKSADFGGEVDMTDITSGNELTIIASGFYTI